LPKEELSSNKTQKETPAGVSFYVGNE